jgi:hypothetical protein
MYANITKHPSLRNDFADAKGSSEYYILRLRQLASYAPKVRRSIFIEAETIVDDTEDALICLQKHLKLREKLEETYSIYSKTGKPGRGDESSYIKTGEIIRHKKRYDNIQIPEEILEKANWTYDSCKEALMTNCDICH